MSEIKKAKLKLGSLNPVEKKYIEQNFKKVSTEEIAKFLSRTPETIEKHIRRFNIAIGTPPKRTDEEELIWQLHTRHYWSITKKKLLPDEIEFFEKQWAALINQFSAHDILHTDEMMITDLIFAEIMLNRNMIRRRDVILRVEVLEKDINNEEEKGVDKDMATMASLRSECNSLISMLETLSREQQNLQVRKDVLFKSLRSTREQRLKQAEESKSNIFLKMAQLNEREQRQKEGKWMELVALAGEKSKDKMLEYTTYDDHSVDTPFSLPGVMFNKDLKEEIDKEETSGEKLDE